MPVRSRSWLCCSEGRLPKVATRFQREAVCRARHGWLVRHFAWASLSGPRTTFASPARFCVCNAGLISSCGIDNLALPLGRSGAVLPAPDVASETWALPTPSWLPLTVSALTTARLAATKQPAAIGLRKQINKARAKVASQTNADSTSITWDANAPPGWWGTWPFGEGDRRRPRVARDIRPGVPPKPGAFQVRRPSRCQGAPLPPNTSKHSLTCSHRKPNSEAEHRPASPSLLPGLAAQAVPESAANLCPPPPLAPGSISAACEEVQVRVVHPRGIRVAQPPARWL